MTVSAAKASTQVSAVPEQWSFASSSQAPPCELPVQLVVADAKLSTGQVPLVPVQLSASSHWPVEGRQVTVLALKVSTQVFAVPEQWSLASLSHTPPCDAPVHVVDADAKLSAGHAPLAPVHISATSHWPADARHVTVLALKVSTHVSLVPRQ